MVIIPTPLYMSSVGAVSIAVPSRFDTVRLLDSVTYIGSKSTAISEHSGEAGSYSAFSTLIMKL
jgi:hypothetical protein